MKQIGMVERGMRMNSIPLEQIYCDSFDLRFSLELFFHTAMDSGFSSADCYSFLIDKGFVPDAVSEIMQDVLRSRSVPQ